MDETRSDMGVPLSLVRGSLVATLNSGVSQSTLDQFRQDLLERLRRTGVRRIAVDASAVTLLDGEDFRALARVVKAASLMGARTVLVGLQPGVVSALVELDVKDEGLETALDLDHGLALLDAPIEDDADEGGVRLEDTP
jgi:rsbT antagonist protein RsbS